MAEAGLAAARPRRLDTAAAMVGGLTLIGLALRLVWFDDALWADELSSYFVIHGFGVDNVLGLVASDQEATPPLFYALSWLTKDLGAPEAGARWVSLLPGVATIPATYLLGLRTVGQRSALVGTALVALSPFLTFYSSEARAYSLATLLGVLAALALLRAQETGLPAWWGTFAVTAAACAYSHYTAIFIPIGLFAWAWFARPALRRPLMLSAAAASLLYLPWGPELLEDRRENVLGTVNAFLHPLSLDNIATDLELWTIGAPFILREDVPGTLGVVLLVAGLAVGALGSLVALRRRRTGDGGPGGPASEARDHGSGAVIAGGLALVGVFALAGPVGTLLVSLVADTIFIPRNLIVSTPGLALVVGTLAAAGPRSIRVASVALLIAGFSVGAVRMMGEQRPDFLAAARYIEERAGRGSPVVEAAQPTPGPQTALEVALADRGKPTSDEVEVLPLGLAPIEERLEAAGPGPPAITDPPPGRPLEETAARAAELSENGPMFLVTSGGASLEELRAEPFVGEFLARLPPGFEEREARTFEGFSGTDVTVHVLERRAPAPSD